MTSPETGPEGAWVEHCELRLQLPGKEPQTYRFGHFDPLPLNLSHVVHIAQELEKKVPVVKEKDELPANYDPRPGDVLKRIGDGPRFRIVRLHRRRQGDRAGGDRPAARNLHRPGTS